MTPNGIEILIHCHVSQTPHPRSHARAVQEEIQGLLANGLIEPLENEPGVYKTTKRGELHIEQLCSVPWPMRVWMCADGAVVED